ncbi:MAG: hypothetical protein ACYTG0_31265 [Planctomycetota bacterium]|jgi:hypothetical protein
MSKLLAFTNFLADRQIALDDLAEFSQLVESIQHDDGSRGYQIRPLNPADKVSQRCKVLIQYTWHCRDYVKKILAENGETEPGRIVNTYIRNSRDIQVISFLANEYKHAGTDRSQKWAVELEPRIGKPYVHGVMRSFPHRLKPTFIAWGESIPEFEFVGSASIGEFKFQFTDFSWTYSCTILDKDGNSLGDAAGLCDNVFQAWLQVLTDNGIQVPNTA